MDSRLHRPHGSSQFRILAPARLTMPVVRFSLFYLLVGLLAALPAFATSKLQTFHIEAGDATFTLNEFSRQSSLQLLFDYNIVRGRKTHAVSGELEAQTALGQMLVDTGL